MRHVLIVFFLCICLSLFAQPGSKNFIDQNYIEITGKAEMEVVPDQIFLKILIDEQDYRGKSTLEELEKSMVQELDALGLDTGKDVVIKDMASNFKNYWVKNSKIFTQKEYQVVCKDANTAGLVFRELEKLGISNISIERIDHSEIQKFRKDVKVQAVMAARDKAGSLAKALEQEIGKAIYIQELNYPVFRSNQEQAAALSNIVVQGAAGAQELPEIEFEKITLTYSILVRFELKE